MRYFATLNMTKYRLPLLAKVKSRNDGVGAIRFVFWIASAIH
ncbi:hypothetical protein ACWIUD_07490 [Helicobacter sp. 23-1044]